MKKKMVKKLFVVMAMAMVVNSFTGCGKLAKTIVTKAGEEVVSVVKDDVKDSHKKDDKETLVADNGKEDVLENDDFTDVDDLTDTDDFAYLDDLLPSSDDISDIDLDSYQEELQQLQDDLADWEENWDTTDDWKTSDDWDTTDDWDATDDWDTIDDWDATDNWDTTDDWNTAGDTDTQEKNTLRFLNGKSFETAANFQFYQEVSQQETIWRTEDNLNELELMVSDFSLENTMNQIYDLMNTSDVTPMETINSEGTYVQGIYNGNMFLAFGTEGMDGKCYVVIMQTLDADHALEKMYQVVDDLLAADFTVASVRSH